MDFEQNEGLSDSLQPQPNQPMSSVPVAPGVKTPKRRTGWKIFWGIITGFSVLANIVLFLLLIGVVALFAVGPRDTFIEEVIQPGPRMNKIAVVNLTGIIDSEQSRHVKKQIDLARRDSRVRAVILRVDSPGGTISGSDQIHNEILKYRDEEGKPVVAFMQGIAASGGYYTSVACDKIIAEPTSITGSVGVIMGYLVLQELLEQKLGIQPVIIKSAEKKDWPNSFQSPTEEQLQYLQDKMVKPAHRRFVQIVNDGRPELNLADVERLADGSIYGAEEALQEKLIDQIGYLDQAVELALSLAGIEDAQVVQYRRPFSLSNLLFGRGTGVFKIDKTALFELGSPQFLYLWTGR